MFPSVLREPMRFIEDFLPAKTIDWLQRVRGVGFFGDYASFDEIASPYIAPAPKDYEIPNYLSARDLQLLAAFAPIDFKTVLDVGGADGAAYYLLRSILRKPIDWTVLETPQVVAENKGKPFIRYVMESSERFDVVHMSGVLQYLSDPYEALQRFAKQGEWLIVNRLPLYSRDRIMKQKTQLGEHSAWLFDGEKMMAAIQSVGRIVFKWKVSDDCPLIDGRRLTYSGILAHIDHAAAA